jgi:hypothetical protein
VVEELDYVECVDWGVKERYRRVSQLPQPVYRRRTVSQAGAGV